MLNPYNPRMFNAASLAAVDAAAWHGPFVRPLYDSYGFANIPATVRRLLTGAASGLPDDALGPFTGQRDAVVLLFVDGLGWRFVAPRLERHPALRHFLDRGVVSKLTAMFPSTTSAHVTAIHTGLPPAQSGVYEWFQYEPALDRMIAPLMFNLAGEEQRDTLLNAGLAPKDVFPPATIYAELRRAGIKSYVMHSRDLVRSAPTQVLSDGATLIGYKTLPEAFVTAANILTRREQPVYVFLYYSPIDAISHEYGPGSDHVDAEIEHFLLALERVLLPRLAGSRALLLVTADHGQVEVDPKTTLYLNFALRDFKRLVAANANGDALTPAGSPRDYFLHIKPDLLGEAAREIGKVLTGRAMVVETEALIAQGLFGSNPSAAFLRRVGNLVVLPYAGESVFYHAKNRFQNRFFGHHGGLTREEMEIPFLVSEM